MPSNMLVHCLSSIPTLPEGETISSFLPNEIDNSHISPLLFRAEAADHISLHSSLKLSFTSMPSFCLIYCTKGSGAISINNHKEIPLSAGTLIIFDCSLGHDIISSTWFEYDIIYYNGPQSGYFFNNLINTDSGIFLMSNFSQTGLNSSLRPILPSGGQAPYVSPMRFHRYLTDFFVDTIEFIEAPRTKKEDTTPEYLLLTKEYIDNNFYESITLKDLEDRFYINHFRLCKEFSNTYYVSPIQYLHQVRVNRAKLLLSESNLKIHEIGYQVGYETSTQFINHFKKHTGITPALYRENIK